MLFLPDHAMLYLASSSPRRQELMRTGGWQFSVLPANIDETVRPGEDPSAYVLRIAVAKAQEVARRQEIHLALHSKAIIHREEGAKGNECVYILAADTTVVDGKDILGKPVDEAEAVCTLSRLRNRIHQVYTGLVLARVERRFGENSSAKYPDGLSMVTRRCMTDVVMRNYSDDEVTNYVASGDPLDKAGSYAIQNDVFNPVRCIRGCYTNVMGLPLCHVAQVFREMGIQPPLENECILTECQKIASEQELDIDGCREIWATHKDDSAAQASSLSLSIQ